MSDPSAEALPEPHYRRVLLKLSGEALQGDAGHGIDADTLDRLAVDVRELLEHGVEVALVIGAGNIFRGAPLAKRGMDRVTADHIGMLGTVINALALQDSLERHGLFARVMSAIRVNERYHPTLSLVYLPHLDHALQKVGPDDPSIPEEVARLAEAVAT